MRFQNTALRYEGLWERMTLFCMYVPFGHRAIYNLFSWADSEVMESEKEFNNR